MSFLILGWHKQVDEILSRRRRALIYPLTVMTSWYKEPGHQQQWINDTDFSQIIPASAWALSTMSVKLVPVFCREGF